MNRRYRVRVPSIRSARKRVSWEAMLSGMAHDLDLLAAAGTLPVIKTRDAAGEPPPFDEHCAAGRAVRVLVPAVGDISEIREPEPKFFCPGTDLLEKGNRGRTPVRHPVIRVERREMHRGFGAQVLDHPPDEGLLLLHAIVRAGDDERHGLDVHAELPCNDRR